MSDDPRRNIVLHVADVHKSFGGLHALSDIDLEIEEGKTRAIIGPNGAGKSTLLNVCVGRLKPDSGTVIFDGETLDRQAAARDQPDGRRRASSRRRRSSPT